MENEFIAWLRERLPQDARLAVAAGDDAAVLRLAHCDGCVLTVDTLTDGVDFRLEEVEPRRIGRKALAVNLSDLAAMAARPVAALVSLVLPRVDGMKLATELYEGLLPLAEEYGVAIAGGDTNSWDGPLAISITVIGETTTLGPLRRSTARAGDAILVTGTFGGSILERQFDFEPRVAEAIVLHSQYRARAGMDVSDGLSLDLSRMAKESQVGAIINEDAIPISKDAHKLSKQDNVSPLEHALGDGEDFELILAMPPNDAERVLNDQPLSVPVTRIGFFTGETGLRIVDSTGRVRPLIPRGYEHHLG